MTLNIEENLIAQGKNSESFAVQLDERIDVINYVQLVAYVEYVYQTEIKEKYLFCETP